ncbi:GNAT family N-acetyltransferase [Deinococcus roseus]|uniref:N-acetyltransferase n=1 Tax=Deinococcus roseus TaxID=392414 RepID=A0ABQ2D196_9DEIO|nr:GNAT family N-acetyltransferase [Deinococcus roseus]GGJ40887.1 N-acetyltransferase [Deinococcus roseus]
MISLKSPLKCLGHQTDLIFARFFGIVGQHADCISIQSPSNRGHYFGNYLIYLRPPQKGDLPVWSEQFETLVGPPEEVRHRMFCWDDPENAGEVQAFLDAGYILEDSIVMTAESLNEASPRAENVEIRPLQDTDEDWAALFRLQMTLKPEENDEGRYAEFKKAHLKMYREMQRQNLGHWYGAWMGGQLVSNMGLFVDDKLARYQQVGTHPDFRRLNLTRTLLKYAAEHALKIYGPRTLVIVADEHHFAKEVYRSAGFEPLEKQYALLKMPGK